MQHVAHTLPHHRQDDVQLSCPFGEQFVEQGGIKERMHAARTGYRKEQDELLKRLQTENIQLKEDVKRLQAEVKRLQERLAQR